jgi:hypothetical protein
MQFIRVPGQRFFLRRIGLWKNYLLFRVLFFLPDLKIPTNTDNAFSFDYTVCALTLAYIMYNHL